jgi:pimeloyl-ACP methyl ester carboxylesterase
MVGHGQARKQTRRVSRFGAGDRDPAYREPHCYQFTFQALAYNTRGLLDLLDVDRVHVLGHSMGGMLATRFALMFPERTEQLALVNPIGLEDWKALGVSYRTVDENYAQELKTTPESIREYERMSYFGGQWNSALTSDMIFTQPVLYEFPLVATRTLLSIGQRGGDRRRRHLPQIEAFDQYSQALLGL